MAKDRQKRMAQVLGCLVASMTTCAVLLNWGQPKYERPAATPTIELIANTVTQPWQSIHINPSSPDGRIDPRQTHFFVDREGHWWPTQTWNAQSHLGQKGVVRIALQPSANTNKMTSAQWDTTRQLMSALQRTCKIPTDRSHIVLSDALAIPPAGSRKVSPASPRTSVGQVDLTRSR